MKGLKIVEYKPCYAKAVAEMWQRSTEGWNGENGNETEETVLAEHEDSADINTYLAVLGEEVLGYCAFSKSLEDEGALHIRRLNVRYDCHGRGIGKILVKKAIERTIELDWPRLDIYTWPANTEAIPLYKKCGYFFENREDTIHLMNFVPTVMHTEAVKGFFDDFDWYDDMKRTINMEPDGREENGFEFYEYCWQKNGVNLRMEFERKGRGIRLIETDDYLISLSAPFQNLIFGRSYKASYEIVNKTGAPLSVEIIGKNDKNIEFALNKKIEVIDKETVEGEFYISEIDEEFGSFKTHPGIVSDIIINGKSAMFKLGIVPKFPGKITLSCDDLVRYNRETFKMYVNIESNLTEKGTFEFEIPECGNIDFSERKFSVPMAEKQKLSIPVECIMKNPALYKAQLDIKVSLECGKSIKFKKRAELILRGRNIAFGGEIDRNYTIVNDIYKLNLNKDSNRVEIYVGNKKKNSYFMYPRLGIPYSEEFRNMKIKNAEWYREDGKMVLSGEYNSKEFNNLTVKSVFKICDNGIFEHFYELINNSEDETVDNIYVDQRFHYRIAGALIPYGNKILYATEPRMEYVEYYNSEKITENWIFSGAEESIIWPKNSKCKFDGWFMHIEHNVGRLKGGEKSITEPIYLAFSTFKDFRELRKFALKSNLVNDVYSAEDFEIEISNGNPFVSDKFDIDIIENRDFSYKGEITVKSTNNIFPKAHIILEDEINKVTIPVEAKNPHGDDLIYVENNFNSVSFLRRAHIFYVQDIKYKFQITEEKGLKVYSINNGVMTIKASPEFSTGIFSLQFMDREWLDTSFPNAGPRSWYNPWFGGIQNVPSEMVENARTLVDENIDVEFVEKTDTFGNIWRGIKTRVCINNSENYKGLKLNQYFLMLPGVPTLLNLTELTNDMDKYMDCNTFTNVAFFKIGDETKHSWVSIKDYAGGINKYRVGVRDYDINPKSSPLYGCDDLDYKVQVNLDFDVYNAQSYLTTRDLVCLNSYDTCLAPKQRKLLPDIFYTFTKEHISDRLLKNLQNIKFE